jgi:DtxR family Mn-dependent transcriptional regulator
LNKSSPSIAIEDYLQGIYGLSAEGEPVISARLARRMGVTPPTAWAAVQRMARDGLISIDAKKAITMTPEGRDLGENIVRRHRLAERFLTDVLGFGWADAHVEAHRFEHGISPKIEEGIVTLLHNPQTCPHGSPIPRSGATIPSDAVPLSQLNSGESATIALISEELEEDTDLLNYLERGHIMPNRMLRVKEKAGGVVILEVDGSQVPLSLEVANRIRVRQAHESPTP